MNSLFSRFLIFIVLIPFIQSFFKIGQSASSSSSMSIDSNSKPSLPLYIDDSVMNPKAHGTCEKPVMSKLRWNCDRGTADRICCFNRHYAEHSV